MSLAKRIIPTILNKRGQLVKGKGFSCDRIVGNALQSAKIYAMRGVDELVILDVTATADGREPDYDMVKKLTETCFSPVTVGGGVYKSEHVRKLLQNGADKVCIGSGYWRQPDCIDQLSAQYGSSTICASLDVADDNIIGAKELAKDLEERGVGEILLQDVRRDGTMQGYNLGLISSIAGSVGVPVIASGGCSSYENMKEAFEAGASAVAVGALFQFEDCTPKGAAEYLSKKGVEVRL